MTDFGGIGAIQARMSQIVAEFSAITASVGGARFGSATSGTLGGDVNAPTDISSGTTSSFDPFGEAYVQALKAAGVVPQPGAPGYDRYMADLAATSATGTTSTDPAGTTTATSGSDPAAGTSNGTAAATVGSDPSSVDGKPTGAAATSLTKTSATAAALAASMAAQAAAAGTSSSDPSATSASSLVGLVAPLDAPTRNGGVYLPAVSASVSTAAGIGAYNSAASLGTSSTSSGSGASATTDPSATPTGASAGKVGGYGGMDVPVELRQYQNGQLPDSVLEPIGQGSHRLWGPAAESWKSAIAAAAADGIDLKITDSYRTYAEQVDLAKRKGLYQNGGLAAVPGTSNHGWGLAVDVNIDNPQVLDWLHNNGWKFGFVEAVKREPWHWEYRPSQA